MRWIFVCMMLFACGPVHALSCLPPDAVRLFEQALQDDDEFLIVRGRITFLEPPNEPPRGSKTPALTQARIDGDGLNRSGFTSPFSRKIVIATSCLGPWCGSLDGLPDMAIFAIRVSEVGLTLDVGPCGGDLVTWSQQGEERLLACYRTGDCAPQRP